MASDVAESPSEAIKKARKELCLGLETIHKDDLVQIDHVNNSLDYDVDDYYISLNPGAVKPQGKPISSYIKLK